MKYVVAISFIYSDIRAIIIDCVVAPIPVIHNDRAVYLFDSADAAFGFLYAVTHIEYPPHDMHIKCYYIQEGQRDFH